MKIPFKISDSLPYILLPISCMCFDEALKISWINGSDILRAFCDSSAHGVIAFLSWLAVSGVNYRSVAESIMCAVIACAIDFDHFAMAESYNLQGALSLTKRPPLHSTSILVPVLPLMMLVILYCPMLWTLPFLTTISVVSHHVRDGHRRGVWFWPLGNTPPLPYWLYLTIIVILPLFISWIVTKISNEVNSVDNV